MSLISARLRGVMPASLMKVSRSAKRANLCLNSLSYALLASSEKYLDHAPLYFLPPSRKSKKRCALMVLAIVQSTALPIEPRSPLYSFAVSLEWRKAPCGCLSQSSCIVALKSVLILLTRSLSASFLAASSRFPVS